ncbi:protein mono-ADP-ribosyltransferase TIPARP-like [Anarrhichthys ocellatus]|uniref:protein mono-ADP-ribosyltransferase TIPARP-like n=1 Tax=Anarrhichthys ocellatus TaxID=433405 RepID=UPI0012EDE6A5|nr:protein mono-ADP-ribosyltransferase TIPARP-like [Anarrhichthys ocellatus]
MPKASSSRRSKRKMADDVAVLKPPSKSSKVTFLSPSLFLLEIPADANSSLPVWEAMRSKQVDIAWTVNPYSIGVHLTPATSKQGKSATPAQTEGASSVAQSSAPSSRTLQPQMVIQSITPQHGASQTSCVLLTLSQNGTQLLPIPPGQAQKIPANPTLATSLIFSLPLIITQPQPAHQPGTPTKRQVLPAIQTPTATPTKLQAPSEGPVPSPFHTKTSSNIQVCDKFLLSLCDAGNKCTMHHTPYPFHWQLWSVVTHQWIDVPCRSQVILEKSYCNIKEESICIDDGNLHCSLVFDSMEINDSSKYDGVRRLTNSDSLIINPYFPSKWKIYWWNNQDWEEYNKDASASLLKSMSEKELECTFYIGSQDYKVDFTTMIQTNFTTGFRRNVRCRPLYRSPDSMRPYLQTGILTEPVGDLPGANFSVDPLEEFSSWYPPVWCLDSAQDYSLVDLPAGTQAYRSVQNFFYESLPETEVDVVGIQQVQNLLHWDKYQRHKAYMQKQHATSQEPLERHLFHGTTKDPSEDICHNNFDPRMAGVNGTSNGFGSYFAPAASFSKTFSAKSGPDEVRCMFLAKVLVGKVSLGRSHYRRPPPLNSRTSQFLLYDTCVDNVDKPTMFVIFDSCQCYPYYLIKYRDLPKVITI